DRRTGGNADNAVAVEILVEGRLYRFQRRIVTRDAANRVREVVAIAVSIPDGVQILAALFPRDVVAAADPFGTDRRPSAGGRGDDRPAVFKRRPRTAADRFQKIR